MDHRVAPIPGSNTIESRRVKSNVGLFVEKHPPIFFCVCEMFFDFTDSYVMFTENL